MIKWLLTILLSLAILSAATPWIQRLGIGRLPGDVRFRVRGRDYFIPFASSVLFCFVAWLVGRVI
ncbi:MAG: DUF2905 domain-containing protein [Burkholderiales bacterium]